MFGTERVTGAGVERVAVFGTGRVTLPDDEGATVPGLGRVAGAVVGDERRTLPITLSEDRIGAPVAGTGRTGVTLGSRARVVPVFRVGDGIRPTLLIVPDEVTARVCDDDDATGPAVRVRVLSTPSVDCSTRPLIAWSCRLVEPLTSTVSD